MDPDQASLTLGFDVGGTKTIGVLFEVATGSIEKRVKVQTPTTSGDIVRSLVGLVGTLSDGVDLAGIGVGLPGLVDGDGVLKYGAHLAGVVDLHLGPSLAEATGLVPVVSNDATLATLAEHRLGAGRGHDNMILVTLGTGIGGGIVIGGQVVKGANGFAGEPGHMMMGGAEIVCACGKTGCWEVMASGNGLAHMGRLAMQVSPDSSIGGLAGGDLDKITGEMVIEAFEHGDPTAGAVVDGFARSVGVGIGSLITLLDPSIVVVGGGLADASDHFLARTRVQVAQSVLGHEYRPAVPVVPATLGPYAGAIGAALSGAPGLGQ